MRPPVGEAIVGLEPLDARAAAVLTRRVGGHSLPIAWRRAWGARERRSEGNQGGEQVTPHHTEAVAGCKPPDPISVWVYRFFSDKRVQFCGPLRAVAAGRCYFVFVTVKTKTSGVNRGHNG